jgi:hypothetical protein
MSIDEGMRGISWYCDSFVDTMRRGKIMQELREMEARMSSFATTTIVVRLITLTAFPLIGAFNWIDTTLLYHTVVMHLWS